MKKNGAELQENSSTGNHVFKFSDLRAQMHTKFQLIVYLGCAFSILIVVLIGALSLYYLNRQQAMDQWLDRNYRIVQQISDIRSQLNDMGMSRNSRTDVSTGGPLSSAAGRYSLSGELASLKSIINGVPQQQKRMTLLRRQLDDLFAIWRRNDTAKIYSGGQLYKQVIQEDEKLGQVRKTLVAINDAEQRVLIQRQAENKDENLQIKRATVAATITILIIVGSLVALIITELQYRKKNLEEERKISKLKSSFISLASHEFRTPLSSILLSVNLINRYAGKGDTETIAKHGKRIESAVKNLVTILEDFLSVEKLDAGKVKPAMKLFSLNTVCSDVMTDMLLIAKPGQYLTYEPLSTNDIVLLDEHLIKNAVINLMSNAIKYAGENAHIFLRTQTDRDKVIIIIGDNGIGIPENEQKNLFKPFFRVNENGNIPGTGLGLNIVMRYVQLMNGTLTVSSIPGKETLFTMTFDMQPEAYSHAYAGVEA